MLATKFPLGQVVTTPGAQSAILEAGQVPIEFLQRHARGDWGDVCAEDKGLNDEALIDGSRLLSVYKTKQGQRIWIITEADRSVTTFLLPSEY
jgi:hypothetical protein